VRAGEITAAHLAWVDGPTMLSFYQANDPGGDLPGPWRQVNLAGRAFWTGPSQDEHAVLWRGGGIIYLLVGDLSDDALPPTGWHRLGGIGELRALLESIDQPPA